MSCNIKNEAEAAMQRYEEEYLGSSKCKDSVGETWQFQVTEGSMK